VTVRVDVQPRRSWTGLSAPTPPIHRTLLGAQFQQVHRDAHERGMRPAISSGKHGAATSDRENLVGSVWSALCVPGRLLTPRA
jgi:hypothetical protein